MAELQRQYLKAMGIEVWQRRDLPVVELPQSQPVTVPQASESAAIIANSEPSIVPTVDVSTMEWDALQRAVSTCERCSLHSTRTQTVFGVGDKQASLMIIGEAPGGDEDRQGEPFVGRAGQLLNEMLRAIGFKREQVYIANILKCRPPHNRDPKVDEVNCCDPYLKRQIALVQPVVVLAVGRIAAQNLLKSSERIGALRGREHQLPGTKIPLIATYHPAYLLRSPIEKRKAWQDLQQVHALVTDKI